MRTHLIFERGRHHLVRACITHPRCVQVLFEAYALQIPESLTTIDSKNVTKGNVYKTFQSVFLKSEMLTMASAMRMAHDFHIIPVLASRQAVAAAFKKCRVVQKSKTEERSGLTLPAFVRFLEGVAGALRPKWLQ